MVERAYPLEWPIDRPRTPSHQRKSSQFNIAPHKAQQHMLSEINLMGGRNVVISTDRRVRQDGGIYAKDLNRTPDDPGVAVYFERKGQRVCFACDQYPKIWENLRAIGKTIEAMRGIERWGSHEMLDRAFTGFAALPPPDAPIPMGIGRQRHWSEVLGVPRDAPWNEIRSAYREKMRDASDEERYDLNAAKAQASMERGDG